MIQNSEDFCLWTYVLVDEVGPQIAPHCRRPGPAPVCSDPELVTMALVGPCRDWDEETVLLSIWHAHRDIFPHEPERSRFNRRRRQLAGATHQVRRLLLATLDLAQDRHCVLDSLPVPVLPFHLVPAANRAEWQTYGTRFGRVPSKKQTIFGYKLYLLTTFTGAILDFVRAPANVAELQVGTELLAKPTDLEVLGDNAFISAAIATELRRTHRLRLLTLPRRTARRQVPPVVRRAFNQARSIIETVNSQLAEPFLLEVNHAQRFGGLCARLSTKLAAHTLCLCLNRLLERSSVLSIERLAFPHPTSTPA